ncbi:M15 family metallopeptidase [Cryobacterium sp. 1639]|uniref:M15 family metallopeptidase n=1 Tax=Cryobacterium inferilacus TaxID=2866629 RepID=UPI001C73CB3A|nr:M15 family metallopeptidase [Cryobacterium sp. 1639]MBX0299281.1 M15 family metallopeptidase [Cryobacterium sp. 1639]
MLKKRTAAILGLVALGGLAIGLIIVTAPSRDEAAAAGAFFTPDTVVGVEDGVVDEVDGISPFADDLPAIAKLDPELRTAMQGAARDAIADGVEFVVTSGWRSAAYQEALFNTAVIEYGSAEVAGEFVLSPEESRHVTGEAVDIGRTDANSWLSQHGADYGLCQTYANEMWHFELATEPGGECPPQLPNAHG